MNRLVAIPLVVGLLAFGPGLAGGFVWDDHVVIAENRYVQGLEHLGDALTKDFWHTSRPGIDNEVGFYRPLPKIGMLLSWVVGGGSPLPFKLLSLALHLACVALAFVWLRRRLATEQAGTPASLAAALLVGASLFALHPSRPEAVSWACATADLWLALFTLAGVLAFESGRPLVRRLIAPLCFLGAMFSKETAVVVPVALAADLWLRGRLDRRVAAELVLPAVAIGVGLVVRGSLVSFRYAPVLGDGPGALVERVSGTFGLALTRVVAPFPPSVLAGALPRNAGGFLIPGWLQATGLVAALLLVVLALAALRRPAPRPWAADLVWLVLPLAPVLNVVPLTYKVLFSERYLYLPLLGACALAARALVRARPPAFRVAAAASGAVLLACTAFTAAHVGSFDGDVALFRREQALHPHDAYAAEMLARSLWGEGAEGALDAARAAAKLAPTDEERLQATLLWAAIRQENTADSDRPALLALRALHDAVADPTAAHVALTLRDAPVATVAITDAGRRKATSGPAFVPQRALLHARTGDVTTAETLFRELVAQAPERSSVRANLVVVLAQAGRFESAREELAKARSALPAEAALWSSLEERIGAKR